jgi:hypothetical protein
MNGSTVGMSHATKLTFDSIRPEMKWTFRARRSSFAIKRVAPDCRQWSRACWSAGRSALVPDSASRYSASNTPPAASRCRRMAACWASRPRPETSWPFVLTRT